MNEYYVGTNEELMEKLNTELDKGRYTADVSSICLVEMRGGKEVNLYLITYLQWKP